MVRNQRACKIMGHNIFCLLFIYSERICCVGMELGWVKCIYMSIWICLSLIITAYPDWQDSISGIVPELILPCHRVKGYAELEGWQTDEGCSACLCCIQCKIGAAAEHHGARGNFTLGKAAAAPKHLLGSICINSGVAQITVGSKPSLLLPACPPTVLPSAHPHSALKHLAPIQNSDSVSLGS